MSPDLILLVCREPQTIPDLVHILSGRPTSSVDSSQRAPKKESDTGHLRCVASHNPQSIAVNTGCSGTHHCSTNGLLRSLWRRQPIYPAALRQVSALAWRDRWWPQWHVLGAPGVMSDTVFPGPNVIPCVNKWDMSYYNRHDCAHF